MKKRIAFLLACCLTLMLSVLPASALELEDAKELLKTYYIDEIPEEILALDSLDAILEALNDPYTVHMSGEEYQEFLTSVNGESVVGIGVSIQTVYTDGFQIMAVLPNSPALEAGLEAGDRVIAVDGVTLTPGMDVSAAIGGKEGTPVTITVIRGSDGKQVDHTMVRRMVYVPIVTYQMFGDAGLIDCSSFGDSTAEVVQEALEALNDEVSIWIIDLRNNPGGTANSAAAAAGFFAGSAIMVYLRNAQGGYTYYFTPGWPDLTDKPLLVLTSPYSASGSELFAAAARDHGFGVGLGQRSYGKGIGQSIFDASNTEGIFSDDTLKLTTFRFYSPNGTTNHIVGIIPTLLVSVEHTPAIAELLSTPEPKNTLAHLKLNLAGHTFYVDLAQARSEEYEPALTELVEALPPAAELFIGAGSAEWEEITPEALAKRLRLDCEMRTFSDVTGSPFLHEIQTLAVYQLLSGYEDGSFRPQQKITRAEFCTMIAAAMNLPANDAFLPFSDTPTDAWYTPYISAMATRGFISGYEDGTFRPNATITYQEMVTILSELASWANMNVMETAEDELTMDEWIDYYEYADWAQRPARNLADLDALVGGLAPTDPGTREVAAGMLCSMMESINLLWNGAE